MLIFEGHVVVYMPLVHRAPQKTLAISNVCRQVTQKSSHAPWLLNLKRSDQYSASFTLHRRLRFVLSSSWCWEGPLLTESEIGAKGERVLGLLTPESSRLKRWTRKIPARELSWDLLPQDSSGGVGRRSPACRWYSASSSADWPSCLLEQPSRLCPLLPRNLRRGVMNIMA